MRLCVVAEHVAAHVASADTPIERVCWVVGDSVLDGHVAHPSDLVGLALLLVPAGVLRTAGTAALPLRVPFTHGDGYVHVKLALAQPFAVDAAVAAVDESAAVNAVGMNEKQMRRTVLRTVLLSSDSVIV